MVGLEATEGLFHEDIVQDHVEGGVLLGDFHHPCLLWPSSGGPALADDEVPGRRDEVRAEVVGLPRLIPDAH
ncbi:hypothetical protein GCM10009740_15740 [Terrabacter terrae]|uniref:Uncharacterized protein n=1 Tax=Terrabacter terrae TaxID=318434 RepID=A0ABN2U2M2_9MICO